MGVFYRKILRQKFQRGWHTQKSVRWDMTADELLAHYKEVRLRLRNPANKVAPKPIEPPQEEPPPVTFFTYPKRSKRPPNTRNARPIIEPILKRLGVTWTEIIDDRRWRPLVLARREVCVALRDAGWSYEAIGRYINRDHSTVIYAIETWKEHKRNAND